MKTLYLLAVYMSTLTYWLFLFLYTFFYAARIGYTFDCHFYTTNFNCLGH